MSRDRLDEQFIDMIEKELGPDKAAWAKEVLHVKPIRKAKLNPDLVLRPGMWLRYPGEADGRPQVEVVKCGKSRCEVLKNGGTRSTWVEAKKLLGYEEMIPPEPKNPIPSWVRSGAHFREVFGFSEIRWVIRTVHGSMFSANVSVHSCFGNIERFTIWFTDELDDSIRHVPTLWDHLDDDSLV